MLYQGRPGGSVRAQNGAAVGGGGGGIDPRNARMRCGAYFHPTPPHVFI